MNLREQIIKYVEDGRKAELQHFLDNIPQAGCLPEEKFWIAFGQHALGRLQAAIDLLSSIATDDKGKLAVLYQKAIYNIELGDDIKAVKDLKEVIRLSDLTGINYCRISASLILSDLLAIAEPFSSAKLLRSVPDGHEIFLIGRRINKKSVEDRISHKLIRK